MIFMGSNVLFAFSALHSKMCPQMVCRRRGKVTLVAFVWLFSTVRFQMYPQMAWMGRGIVTLVAFVWHFSFVSTKCKQCDVASSGTKHLRIHLKMYSGEKSNKCNQCDYAFSQLSNLKIHFKTHSGEKSNKCNSNLTILCLGRPLEGTFKKAQWTKVKKRHLRWM